MLRGKRAPRSDLGAMFLFSRAEEGAQVAESLLVMRYLALAADYDGTLARHGEVAKRTVDALEQLKATGRKLILVTGRTLDRLLEIFPRIDVFDHVVAENCALLYRPTMRAHKRIAVALPASLLRQ